MYQILMSQANSFFAGVFYHEHGQRLLQILVAIGNRGFEGLYTRCVNNLKGEYYKLGLSRVDKWPDSVIQEDIDEIRKTFPDFEDTYETCFINYVDDRYRGQKKAIVTTPAVVSFVRTFLTSLGAQDSLKTAEYFTRRDLILQRITCMDACRQAFVKLTTSDSVRVELLSEAGSRVGSRSVTASERQTPLVPVRELSEASHKDLVDAEVLPSDSVSQVSVARPPPKEVDDTRDISDPPMRSSESVVSRTKETQTMTPPPPTNTPRAPQSV